MILLDSDHLTVLTMKGNSRRDRLLSRLATTTDSQVGSTIVSIEEQLRGWLASIAKERLIPRQTKAYFELQCIFDFFTQYHIASFDQSAVACYEAIKRIRIGTMDLKIAATAIANGATLLAANRRDLEKVSGLRFENWLD